jgi:autotransporter-associated beta strand protein
MKTSIAFGSRNCKQGIQRFACALSLLASGLVLFLPAPAHAQSGTWTLNGNGNWATNANWSGGIVADGATNLASFSTLNITANRTVTLDSSRTIGSIQFGDTSGGQTWTLNSAGGSTLTMDNGVNKPLVRCLQNTATISVVLDGTNGMRVPDQTGTIVYNAANIYSGDTEISRGTLRYGVVGGIPSGLGKGNVILRNDLGNPNDAGKLDINNVNPTINGLNCIIDGSKPMPLVTSSAAAGTSTLTVGSNDANGAFGGIIQNGTSRTVALTKTGAGSLILSNANTYSGATTINGGILQLGVGGSISSSKTVNVGAGALLDASLVGGFTVGSGNTLMGNGTVTGAVTAAFCTVAGGASAGTLTLANGLDLSAGGTNAWELAANVTNNPGVNYDRLVVAGGNLVLGGSSQLLISFISSATVPDATNAFWQQTNKWTIISLGAGGSNSGPTTFSGVVSANTYGTFSTAADGSGNIVLTFAPTPPVADFVGAPTSGSAPLTVNFTNLSAGATNYLWDFGDGNTSTATSPANTYATAGTYNVSLRAIGPFGTNSLTNVAYIVVTNPPPPVANFVAAPTNGFAPLTVNFTNLSANGVSYLWAFGDSSTSTSANPAHVYTGAGSYTVSLTAMNPAGTNSITNVAYIVVTNLPPPVISQNLAGAGTTNVLITFSSVSGITYQVQYKGDLTNGAWSVLGSLLATGASTTVADNTSPVPARRFYRIIVP